MASLLSYALTNLSDVKETLGIASSVTTYDNLIIRKINQATLLIQNYCGRHFLSAAYTDEVYNPTNIDEIILKQRPVISVASFSVRDTTYNDDDWEVIDTDLYFIDYNAGILKLLFNAGGRWQAYKTTYTAGYATIPDDLAEACAILAAYYYNNGNGQAGVKAKTEGQRKIEYYDSNSGISGLFEDLGIDATINQYANFPIMTDR